MNVFFVYSILSSIRTYVNTSYIIAVGQCGNQIGSAFWPLALHEYGIQTTSGGVNLLKVQRDHAKHVDDLSHALHSFFRVPDAADNLHFQSLADLTKARAKARVRNVHSPRWLLPHE